MARLTLGRRLGRFRLIDLPECRPKTAYDSATARVVDALAGSGFVDSIYRVGGTRHPGISDIDLLVVAADDSMSALDPLAMLDPEERYLFTHSVFVVPASLAPDVPRFILLRGYELLHGTDYSWQSISRADQPFGSRLDQQTALEFLAKNVIDLYVQLTYRMIKARVLLQHLKGVLFDLNLVGADNDKAEALGAAVMSVADEWFRRSDSSQRALRLAVDAYPVLVEALADACTRLILWSPAEVPLRFAPNVTLVGGSRVALRHRGIRVPSFPGLADRRHFNANHRVNTFEAEIPFTPAPPGSYHAGRFDVLCQAKEFATTRLPGFTAPIPPLFYHAL